MRMFGSIWLCLVFFGRQTRAIILSRSHSHSRNRSHSRNAIINAYLFYIYNCIYNEIDIDIKNKNLHIGFENMFEEMVGRYEECLSMIMVHPAACFIFVFENVAG